MGSAVRVSAMRGSRRVWSSASVAASTRPVGSSPCLIWNQLTAPRVRGPKRPSTRPTRYPRACNSRCTARTRRDARIEPAPVATGPADQPRGHPGCATERAGSGRSIARPCQLVAGSGAAAAVGAATTVAASATPVNHLRARGAAGQLNISSPEVSVCGAEDSKSSAGALVQRDEEDRPRERRDPRHDDQEGRKDEADEDGDGRCARSRARGGRREGAGADGGSERRQPGCGGIVGAGGRGWGRVAGRCRRGDRGRGQVAGCVRAREAAWSGRWGEGASGRAGGRVRGLVGEARDARPRRTGARRERRSARTRSSRATRRQRRRRAASSPRGAPARRWARSP